MISQVFWMSYAWYITRVMMNFISQGAWEHGLLGIQQRSYSRLRLYIEACATTTATRCGWITHYLELASNQFHRVVNLAAFE